MKTLLAVSILGLDKHELTITLLFTQLSIESKGGEVPGRNLRQLLDITKDDLFHILEKLLQKGVFKFSDMEDKSYPYICAGDKGYYIFNKDYKDWTPVADSLFYKLCKLLGYRYNSHSYNSILNELDLRQNLVETKDKVVDRITPYEIYDYFMEKYKGYFGKEYSGLNQFKDLQTLKNIIYKFSYSNIGDSHIKEFVNWCFQIKAATFKGSNFIIGFLPMCLQDYLKTNIIEKIDPLYTKNEDGRLQRKI
jgi:hypothetical protein